MGQANVCPLNVHLQRRSQRSGVKKITYKPINTLWSIEYETGADDALAIMRFDQPVLLTAGSGDEIKLKVQDDLDTPSMIAMKVYVIGYKL